MGLDSQYELALTAIRVYATPKCMAHRHLHWIVRLAFEERTDLAQSIAGLDDV